MPQIPVSARYFIAGSDVSPFFRTQKEVVVRALMDPKVFAFGTEQLSLFAPGGAGLALPGSGDVKSIGEACEEAVLCLAAKI